MKKILSLIAAFVLMVSFCAVTVSAAKYGRDPALAPNYGEAAAKGNYVYYFSENNICRLHITDGEQKTICEVIEDYPKNLCVMGNCLYYTATYTTYEADGLNSYDAVYKVDIGSGKQTKILDCGDSKGEIFVKSLITAGDRIYILMHEVNNNMYYIDIRDTNGKHLDNFTSCIENDSFFIDASSCEACAATKEKENIYTIIKIKSDLSNEKITIPAKIGENVKKFVYCGKKYVYYIDNDTRLCRYNTETKKIRVLTEMGVTDAHYKNGALYFATVMGDLKKYEKGNVSMVKNAPDNGQYVIYTYFFDDYILYYDNVGQTYSIVYYSGKKTMSVDLAKKAERTLL